MREWGGGGEWGVAFDKVIWVLSKWINESRLKMRHKKTSRPSKNIKHYENREYSMTELTLEMNISIERRNPNKIIIGMTVYHILSLAYLSIGTNFSILTLIYGVAFLSPFCRFSHSYRLLQRCYDNNLYFHWKVA